MRKAEQNGEPVAEIRLTQPARLADALQAVRDIEAWRYNEPIPTPTPRVLTHMRQMILAVAPLTARGPATMWIGPSVYGGLYVRFFDEHEREIAVVLRNDESVRCIYGRGWGPFEGVEATTLEEAIASIKERFEDAASLRQSA